MSESQWLKKGETLSHKKACKEFGLTEDEVIGVFFIQIGMAII